MTKIYGHISYNLHCNFTNYGSALHTYALQRVINSLSLGQVSSIVVNYCPDVLKDKDVLNPLKNLWDSDEESKRMVELTMPAIRVNNEKFNQFYNKYYPISSQLYTSENFNESLTAEGLYGYICGSDTIWCIREFKGFDDGFFGNYPVMKESHTFSYAASFGDVDWTEAELQTLADRMQNFKAIGVRESVNFDYIRNVVAPSVPVQRVLDPTLLLTGIDYECITAPKQLDEPYILLYVRRYNKAMEEYTEKLAEKLNCKIVEISLRAINADKGHIMRYDSGVEEFLSLTKYAECVVTNSFHGAIFGIQMHRLIRVFSREQADTKIDELLGLLGLTEFKMITGKEIVPENIDYDRVEQVLNRKRKESLEYLRTALEIDD